VSVGAPCLFATVGRDHRPFDRLVRWVDEWLEANVERGVEAYLHIGASRAPRWPVWASSVDEEELALAAWAATAVVCDGAPGSIGLCSGTGRTPIVVPRAEQLGACRWLAGRGRIRLAEQQDRFDDLLAAALGDCTGRRRA
jgi:hypothetical protein